MVTSTCLRAHTREDAEFYPAESVFGSQPVLPGQFLLDLESPSPSLLAEFQGVISGCTPLPTAHHALPAPSALPEELLLARFVLVLRDGVHPPLSPAYDGPFAVLERSSHFFKLQMGLRAASLLAAVSPPLMHCLPSLRRRLLPQRNQFSTVPATSHLPSLRLSRTCTPHPLSTLPAALPAQSGNLSVIPPSKHMCIFILE